MLHSEPEQAFGSSGTTSVGSSSSTPDPDATTGTAGASASPHARGQPQDQPTLHEFLTRLVGDPQARSAFEADPRGCLNGAGLGDMTATDVLQGASLVLDYAPVEVVQEYGRSVQSSVEMFAAGTQHVAINQLHPASEHELQEATEHSMLNNSGGQADYSNEGDVDEQMPAPMPQPSGNTDVDISNETNVQQNDSHNLINVHDVANGNLVGNSVDTAVNTVGNTVGVVGNTVAGVGNTVDNTVNTVGNTVDSTVGTAADLTGGVPGAVQDVAGDLPVDDVTSTVGNVAGNVPAVGGVTNSLGLTEGGPQPMDAQGATGLVGNVAGGAVGEVQGLVGNVAGGAVGEVQNLAGGATSDLPLDLL